MPGLTVSPRTKSSGLSWDVQGGRERGGMGREREHNTNYCSTQVITQEAVECERQGRRQQDGGGSRKGVKVVGWRVRYVYRRDQL